MDSYRILTTKRFLRHLKRLDSSIRDRIIEAIREVSERPYLGSTLIFDERRLHKFRVGDYRVIYEIDDEKKAILFLIVDHRRRVYREFKS